MMFLDPSDKETNNHKDAVLSPEQMQQIALSFLTVRDDLIVLLIVFLRTSKLLHSLSLKAMVFIKALE